MKITIFAKQELGKQSTLLIQTEGIAEPIDLMAWISHQSAVSKELTGCNAVNPQGIFCYGLNTFTKPCGATVSIDFSDLDWRNVDKIDVNAVANYIKAAVKLVRRVFNEKYPAVESSITFDI